MREYEALIDRIPVPLLMTDCTGVIRQINARACALFARSRPELAGTPILRWIAPDDRIAARLRFERTLGGETVEWTAEAEAGIVTRPFPFHATPLPGAGTGILVHIRERWSGGTGRHRADAFGFLAEQLSDHFLAVLDNGLRLRAMHGVARLLWLDEADLVGSDIGVLIEPDAAARERLAALRATVATSLNRMLERVAAVMASGGDAAGALEDALRASRTLAEYVEPMDEAVSCDAGAAVRAALADLQEEIDACGVVVETRVLDEMSPVAAPPAASRAALRAILRNALDAVRDAGSRSISVELAQREAGVVIRVSDTGCGVPPGAVDRLSRGAQTVRASRAARRAERSGDAVTLKPRGRAVETSFRTRHGVMSCLAGSDRPSRGRHSMMQPRC